MIDCQKIVYFIVIIKRTLVEKLARLFRINIWKLHRLLESMISDRRPQFVTKLTKKLNRILGIKTFYLQTDICYLSILCKEL